MKTSSSRAQGRENEHRHREQLMERLSSARASLTGGWRCRPCVGDIVSPSPRAHLKRREHKKTQRPDIRKDPLFMRNRQRGDETERTQLIPAAREDDQLALEWQNKEHTKENEREDSQAKRGKIDGQIQLPSQEDRDGLNLSDEKVGQPEEKEVLSPEASGLEKYESFDLFELVSSTTVPNEGVREGQMYPEEPTFQEDQGELKPQDVNVENLEHKGVASLHTGLYRDESLEHFELANYSTVPDEGTRDGIQDLLSPDDTQKGTEGMELDTGDSQIEFSPNAVQEVGNGVDTVSSNSGRLQGSEDVKGDGSQEKQPHHSVSGIQEEGFQQPDPLELQSLESNLTNSTELSFSGDHPIQLSESPPDEEDTIDRSATGKAGLNIDIPHSESYNRPEAVGEKVKTWEETESPQSVLQGIPEIETPRAGDDRESPRPFLQGNKVGSAEQNDFREAVQGTSELETPKTEGEKVETSRETEFHESVQGTSELENPRTNGEEKFPLSVLHDNTELELQEERGEKVGTSPENGLPESENGPLELKTPQIKGEEESPQSVLHGNPDLGIEEQGGRKVGTSPENEFPESAEGISQLGTPKTQGEQESPQSVLEGSPELELQEAEGEKMAPSKAIGSHKSVQGISEMERQIEVGEKVRVLEENTSPLSGDGTAEVEPQNWGGEKETQEENGFHQPGQDPSQPETPSAESEKVQILKGIQCSHSEQGVAEQTQEPLDEEEAPEETKSHAAVKGFPGEELPKAEMQVSERKESYQPVQDFPELEPNQADGERLAASEESKSRLSVQGILGLEPHNAKWEKVETLEEKTSQHNGPLGPVISKDFDPANTTKNSFAGSKLETEQLEHPSNDVQTVFSEPFEKSNPGKENGTLHETGDGTYEAYVSPISSLNSQKTHIGLAAEKPEGLDQAHSRRPSDASSQDGTKHLKGLSPDHDRNTLRDGRLQVEEGGEKGKDGLREHKKNNGGLEDAERDGLMPIELPTTKGYGEAAANGVYQDGTHDPSSDEQTVSASKLHEMAAASIHGTGYLLRYFVLGLALVVAVTYLHFRQTLWESWSRRFEILRDSLKAVQQALRWRILKLVTSFVSV